MGSERLPAILDGKFFRIIKEQDGKVIAKCVNCVNNELSGAMNATSNFLRHLRNEHSSLVKQYEDYKKKQTHLQKVNRKRQNCNENHSTGTHFSGVWSHSVKGDKTINAADIEESSSSSSSSSLSFGPAMQTSLDSVIRRDETPTKPVASKPHGDKCTLRRAKGSSLSCREHPVIGEQAEEENEEQKVLDCAEKQQLEIEIKEGEQKRTSKRTTERLEKLELELHDAEEQQISSLKIAETLHREADLKLTRAMSDKNIVEHVVVAHALYDVARRRMNEATQALVEISRRRRGLLLDKKASRTEVSKKLRID